MNEGLKWLQFIEHQNR